ncbi:unnamed protein product, partial [Effrenium voratum]
ESDHEGRFIMEGQRIRKVDRNARRAPPEPVNVPVKPTASKRFNARALEAGRKSVVRTVSPTVSAGHFKPTRRFLAELDDMLTTNLRAAEGAK